MKKSTNIRYKADWIDFKQDGMSTKEIIKGKDKKYLSKWSRKKFLKNLDKDYNDYEDGD